ncbi:MAG: hypothetical protein CM1200mP24_05420 [Gammaproteobacteria bacterium]|nr:MAG: hypothetical protein CM1200mP24_05420 [Gammaproteobacteria bacterium]
MPLGAAQSILIDVLANESADFEDALSLFDKLTTLALSLRMMENRRLFWPFQVNSLAPYPSYKSIKGEILKSS